MILSDRDIKKYLENGKIKITPFPNLKIQLGSASLDLRLGKEFRVFNHRQQALIDVKNPADFEKLTTLVKMKKTRPFILHPGEFTLGTTLENVTLADNLCARIDGRSSIGRLGVVIHSTAGHIDPGWSGHLTMEISNIGNIPVLLYPGMRICQLVFETLTSPSEIPYNKKESAKYIGATAPQESKLGEEK